MGPVPDNRRLIDLSDGGTDEERRAHVRTMLAEQQRNREKIPPLLASHTVPFG